MKRNKTVKTILLTISIMVLSCCLSFYILKGLPASDKSVTTVSLWDAGLKDLFLGYEWDGRCAWSWIGDYEFGSRLDWQKSMYFNDQILEENAKKYKVIGSNYKSGDHSHNAYSKSNAIEARNFNHTLDDFNMIKDFVLLYSKNEQDRVVANSTLFKKNGRSTPFSNYIHKKIRNEKNDQLDSIRIKVFIIVFISFLISLLISYKLFLKENSK